MNTMVLTSTVRAVSWRREFCRINIREWCKFEKEEGKTMDNRALSKILRQAAVAPAPTPCLHTAPPTESTLKAFVFSNPIAGDTKAYIEVFVGQELNRVRIVTDRVMHETTSMI